MDNVEKLQTVHKLLNVVEEDKAASLLPDTPVNAGQYGARG